MCSSTVNTSAVMINRNNNFFLNNRNRYLAFMRYQCDYNGTPKHKRLIVRHH